MPLLTGRLDHSSGLGRQCQQQQQQQQRQPQQLWTGVAGCSRRTAVLAAAGSGPEPGSKAKQPAATTSSRNARLYELVDDDGWGVEAVPSASQPQPAAAGAAAATPASASKQKQKQKQQVKPAKGKARQAGTPFADMRSSEGKLGLTLLQKVLQNEEQEQQQQQQPAGDSKPSLDAIKAQLAAAGNKSKALKPKLPGFPKAGAAAAAGAGVAAGQHLLAGSSSGLYDDGEEEDEDWDEDESTPAFEITFDETGFAALQSFTSDGGSDAAAAAGQSSLEEELDDFGMSGWGQFGGEDAVLQEQPAAKPKRKQSAAAKDEEEEAAELALLRDMGNEDDWGLEALTNPGASTLGRQLLGGRRSLVDELTAAEEGEDLTDDSSSFASSVRWGGTAGTTGIDMEEQEAILTRYFRPDQVKKLMKEQQEVDENYSVLRRRAVGVGVSDHKLQEKLRIVSGSAAGRKLISFRSPQTRPMMEKVRQAVFNMLQSRAGTLNSLPRSARWLDLFAGTGSVGLEALSRGSREAHFVEMDQVVVSKILERNIKSCGFKGRAWTHTTKAEDFLRRSAAVPRFAGGPFDFISVCPPYLLVSYPELFELLNASPLVHPGTLLFVEYPKQLSHQIVDTIGPLQRVRDRRYGRTWVALYAAGGDGDDGSAGESGGAADEQDDPFLSMQL